MLRWILNIVYPLITKAELYADKYRSKSVSEYGTAGLRLSVCSRCPAFTKYKTCSDCGCFMPIKTQLANAKCPRGNW